MCRDFKQHGNLVFAFVTWVSLCSATFGQPTKKLIHFGIDTPNTATMRQHIAEMEQSPFDGWVFYAAPTTDPAKRGDFGWKTWGSRVFTKAQMQTAVDDLQSTPFKTLTHNFMRINTTPGDVDWFDSFDNILKNMRVAAWVAKQSGIKGILFDPEEYEAPLWDYHRQRDASTKSFEEYAAQVRRRGIEVMNAFQSEYPNITLFIPVATSYIYHKEWPAMYGGPEFAGHTNDPQKLHYFCYGLLAPFLNGMVEAAGPQVRLIDGSEFTYLHTRKKEFYRARRDFTHGVLPYVEDAKKYRRVFTQGFGVWLDAIWYKDENGIGRGNELAADGSNELPGWSATDFSRNYRQPDELQIALTNALEETDEYVWLYAERVFYWGSDKNIPDAYEKAIRDARAAVGLP